MNSKQYLISKLEDLHSKFSNLSIRYQYDSYTQMHIVEILPLDEYSSNKDYIELEADLSFEFDNKFFPESVMFISSESLTKITKSEFEILPELLINITPRRCSSKDFSFDISKDQSYINDKPCYTNYNLHLAA